MKADSVRPASLRPKLGKCYIFYIMRYNRHTGRCSVFASVTVLPRGKVSNLGAYLQCLTTDYTLHYHPYCQPYHDAAVSRICSHGPKS